MRGLWSFAGLGAADERLAAILEGHGCAAIAAGDAGGRFTSTGAIAADTPEPEGFTREGTPDGWRAALSRRDARYVWREAGELLRSLGYDEDGRAAP
jgi:hypothetical protein